MNKQADRLYRISPSSIFSDVGEHELMRALSANCQGCGGTCVVSSVEGFIETCWHCAGVGLEPEFEEATNVGES
jgi:hypothetical protein